jgi:hypothetical protein
MAKRLKRPGFRSQLGDQLGSLLTNAFQQLDSVREVVTKGTKAGRVQLDLVLLKRKRKDALAALGEVVLRLAHSGRIDEDELPELGDPLAELEALDEKIEREERRARAVANGLPDDVAEEDAEEPWSEAAGEFDEDGSRTNLFRRRRGDDDELAADGDEADATGLDDAFDHDDGDEATADDADEPAPDDDADEPADGDGGDDD